MAFVLAIAFFIPMSSGTASAALTGSETDIVWADNLGGSGVCFFYDVTAAPDGGFAAVGFTTSSTLANRDGSFSLGMIDTGGNTLIVKYDSDGNIVWADNLGGGASSGNYFYSVTAAPDGGFVAVGTMGSTTLVNSDGTLSLGRIGQGDTLIVKYDSDGNIEWADNLGGGTSNNYFNGVTTAPDGGFVAVGIMGASPLVNSSGSFSLGKIGTGTDTLVVKYDADGNIEWADNLGEIGYSHTYFRDVTTAPDGGFVAVGYMGSTTLVNSGGTFSLGKIGTGSHNTLILKYDANGNIEWADNLGGGGWDFFDRVAAAPDGGFVAIGTMGSTTLANSGGSFSLGKISGIYDTLIVKYDSDGNAEWGDNLGGATGYSQFFGVTAAPDGGFAAVGTTTSATLVNSGGSFSLGKIGTGSNTLVVEYDSDGNIEWADNFGGGTGTNCLYGVTTAPDGGFAAVGFITSATLANSDGSFGLGMIGAGSNTLIVKYTGTPIEFTVTVTGNKITSWSPATVTYGDVNVEITFVTESEYRVTGIVSVFMGATELTNGTDYVFENGILKILGPVTGDLSVEVRTSSSGGTGGKSVTGGTDDLWWVLIAALSVLSLLLLLGFIAERRRDDEDG